MRRDCDGHLLTSRWRLTVGKAEGPGACPREPAALGAEEGPREREAGAEGHSLSPGHLGPQRWEEAGRTLRWSPQRGPCALRAQTLAPDHEGPDSCGLRPPITLTAVAALGHSRRSPWLCRPLCGPTAQAQNWV